uniref:Uncharacterized protein n=1 Tax=Spermophilus dauricus TaxID=99837 RepID=A0A8C9Q7L5_SPEDA
MQSGGGVETDDTSTLSSVCGYAWCVLGKKNQGADSLPLSSSASIPGLPHTHWTWYGTAVWSEMQHGVEEGGDSVLSAYWKCTVGIFLCGKPLMPSVPHFPCLCPPVSCLCLRLCVILLASCTELTFFPKV